MAAALKKFDWVIKGGVVIDPANHLHERLDLGIQRGQIRALERNIDPSTGGEVFEAGGKFVCPGLIDLHTHVFDQFTPLGVSSDHSCLQRGVTTVVDAGSAGWCTFPGLRRHIAERAQTRILAFLNVSSAGLAFAGLGGDEEAPGELDSLKLISLPQSARFIESNRDLIVGIKVRLSASCADEGRNEREAYEKAKELAQMVGLPLMVHHSFSTVSLDECLLSLRGGDIYTHFYHGFPGTIVDSRTSRVLEPVFRARQRGVLFDIGHGQGSFNWRVAEISAAEGLLPDTISSDLHMGCVDGPAYDLPTVMTRCLHVGMRFEDIIEATTIAPAKAIGWEDRIGTLDVGRQADVTVLSIDEVDVALEDANGQMREIKKRIMPVAVWRDGHPIQVSEPERWPNHDQIDVLKRWSTLLEIRDRD